MLTSVASACSASGVTERIIEVLPQMSCPHRIEPHQIQGLDCVHIYAVMQVRDNGTRRDTKQKLDGFSQLGID